MNDDLKRYPLVAPSERLEFQAFKWGLATGFVFGLGVALIAFVGAAWVFS